MGDDALDVNKMNVKTGGKQQIIRDGMEKCGEWITLIGMDQKLRMG